MKVKDHKYEENEYSEATKCNPDEYRRSTERKNGFARPFNIA